MQTSSDSIATSSVRFHEATQQPFAPSELERSRRAQLPFDYDSLLAGFCDRRASAGRFHDARRPRQVRGELLVAAEAVVASRTARRSFDRETEIERRPLVAFFDAEVRARFGAIV